MRAASMAPPQGEEGQHRRQDPDAFRPFCLGDKESQSCCQAAPHQSSLQDLGSAGTHGWIRPEEVLGAWDN